MKAQVSLSFLALSHRPQCIINRRVPWGLRLSPAACGGAGALRLLPQETGFGYVACVSAARKCQFTLSSVHPVTSAMALSQHVMGAGTNIMTKVRAHLKEYAPQMKTAPASPASSPCPVFCPPSLLPASPDLPRRQEASGQRM